MRLLLDTHFLVWLAIEPAKIRARERAAIVDHQDRISVSTISLWEIRTKWDTFGRGGARADALDPAVAAAYVAASGFAVEPFTPDIAIAPLETPIDHADPFDRILLVHTQHIGGRLLTRDAHLKVHPLSLPL